MAAAMKCGENLTYSYDPDDGNVLIISGIGPMWNYCYDVDEDCSPWHSSIHTVIIEDGVTSIGGDAFYNCSMLVNVVIPKTVKDIGSYAFHGCGLFRVYYGGRSFGDLLDDITQGDKYQIEWMYKELYEADVTRQSSFDRTFSSNRCGDNLYWSIMREDGNFCGNTLVIYGKGNMYDYDDEPAPWKEELKEVYKVVIQEGVTCIGKNAFAAEEKTKSIGCETFNAQFIDEGSYFFTVVALVIPESVKVIKKDALKNCRYVTFIRMHNDEENVTIEDDSFENSEYWYRDVYWGTEKHKFYLPDWYEDID